MKITIYELLGLVKDDDAPRKIKYKNNIYEYDGETQNYCRPINCTLDFLIGEDITALLNDEVEIIMINRINKKDIDNILKDTLIKVEKYGDKTTILKATLPNGFVIIESSSCVDPANFDMKMGEEICMDKLVNKIWELEGYKLQSELIKK